MTSVSLIPWLDNTEIRVPFVPLYKVLKPLVRLLIPSIYKFAFWETVMQAGMTSERLHRAWPCFCQAGPALPGRAHFFYQCPMTLYFYSRLFQVDLQEVQSISSRDVCMFLCFPSVFFPHCTESWV